MQKDSIEPEVRYQGTRRSDERLKEAIDRIDGALASLRELDAPEVRGQGTRRSDERLKQSIVRLDGALGALHRL